MSRNIIQKKSISALDESSKEDLYVSKIIKLIPADIISVYLAIFNIIKSSTQNENGNAVLQWIVFVLILIITPIYLKKIALIRSTKQIVFCTISFAVWVFSLGGPLDGEIILGYSPQFLGAVFLPIYTLIIPLIYNPKP